MTSASKKREPDTTTIKKFPFKLCPKNVSDNDNAILCDLRQTWVHIKCNHLNYIDYKYLQGCNEPSWYCLTTILFLFGNLNNQQFLGFVNDNNNNNNESKNSNSSLILKPPTDLALLFNQFNNAILKITVIQKMSYKANIIVMILMNCNN